MAKIMDPILPILSILGYWAIILGSFVAPHIHEHVRSQIPYTPYIHRNRLQELLHPRTKGMILALVRAHMYMLYIYIYMYMCVCVCL